MGSMCLFGQTVSGFENVIPKLDSAYNGSNSDLGKVSGAAFFWNNYNTSWGSWTGFAFSSKTDTAAGTWSNQYSSISGNGENKSRSYAVAYSAADISFTESNAGDSIYGFSVNNSTYACKTIRDGNSISKKFGGTSGNDTDYFRLNITGFINDVEVGKVVFYLADYRYPDNTNDYIVKHWTWVDLKSLGKVDHIKLSFESTDIGQFGINTPTYVCLDSLVYKNSSTKFRPVAEDDQFLSAFDGVVNSYKVLANDKDPDGTLTGTNMKIISSFKQGTTNAIADGTIELVQNQNAYGWDTCLYSITDADLLSDTAEFVLLINESPQALNDTFTIAKSTMDSLWVVKNDTDEVKDSLIINILKTPSKGTATITNNGAILYTANARTGNDTIKYQIKDEFGLIDSALVYIMLDITTSTEKSNPSEEISVYPNPAKDVLNIRVLNEFESTFSLTDMSGRKVKSGKMVEELELSVSEMPRGIYLFSIGDEKNRTQQKIVLN